MKRSRSLSLVLMGSLMFGMQGCSENKQEESFSVFTSMSECVNSGIFSEEECRSFAVDAVKQSPRFATQQECEQQFGEGQCAAPQVASGEGQSSIQPHSGSMWMPMLMGFMAGRMLSGGNYYQSSQPLYRDTKAPAGEKSFRTAGGETVKPNAAGKVTNPSAKIRQSLSHNAKPATARTGVKSSGGFSGGSKFGGSGS